MALIEYPNDNYDCFITLADCNDFLASNMIGSQRTAYDALGDADKEIYIRQATNLIKNKITLPDTLEDDLKHATAYLVNYSIGKDMVSHSNDGNVKSKKVDIIETEYFSQTKNDNDFPEIVDSLLSGFSLKSESAFVFERA